MNEKTIARAEEIVKGNTGEGTHCVLALVDIDGCPTASTITASKAKGIDYIYFCTGIESNKSKRIEKNDLASICFTSEEYNITLKGRFTILTDSEIKKEMWYDGLKNHFTGFDDPQYCVLRFETKSYNLLVDWVEATGTL